MKLWNQIAGHSLPQRIVGVSFPRSDNVCFSWKTRSRPVKYVTRRGLATQHNVTTTIYRCDRWANLDGVWELSFKRPQILRFDAVPADFFIQRLAQFAGSQRPLVGAEHLQRGDFCPQTGVWHTGQPEHVRFGLLYN